MPTRTKGEASIAALTVTSETWRSRASCSNPDPNQWDNDDWYSDDSAAVAKCRSLCRSCSVVKFCADEVMRFELYSDTKQLGTMGGITTAQRIWLRANPAMAAEVARDCAQAGISTDALADYHEVEGPTSLPANAQSMTAYQVAVHFGVSQGVFRGWMIDRGLDHTPADGRTSKVHLDAYELAEHCLVLAAHEGDGWVPQTEITEVLRKNLPLTAVSHTKKAQSGNVKAAWGTLAYSVIQSWLRAGRVQQRDDPDAPSRRQLRWLGDTLPSGR